MRKGPVLRMVPKLAGSWDKTMQAIDKLVRSASIGGSRVMEEING